MPGSIRIAASCDQPLGTARPTAWRRDVRHRRNRRRSRAASSRAGRRSRRSWRVRRARISARSPATHCARLRIPQSAPIWPSWLGQMATVSRNFSTSASRSVGGDDGADAVAGQAVGLGKGIKLDQRVGPVGIGEKIVRARRCGCRNRGRFRPRSAQGRGRGRGRGRRAGFRPDIRRRRGCWG